VAQEMSCHFLHALVFENVRDYARLLFDAAAYDVVDESFLLGC
jgi:hypothetical protein